VPIYAASPSPLRPRHRGVIASPHKPEPKLAARLNREHSVGIVRRYGRSRSGGDKHQREVASCDPASELETDGVVERPIALEGVADFSLHDRRPASVELPASRFLHTAARQKSSSPIQVVPSRAFRER
jgi:hypothetical protein